MARKNLLAGLLDPALPSPPPGSAALDPQPEIARAPSPTAPTFAGRGAVGAMGRSLERLTSEMVAARSLEQQLAAGATAVEIDPNLVDPSPVPDRLAGGSAEEDAAFVAAIRERGQETPILVRPHPTQAGRYQVAFGHRRLRAARALGRPVKALVRALTDEALVIAQGQENSARADLTFIERASFAAALEARGHGREVIMAALVVDKTELSRLIAVRGAIPDFVVTAIGPAPRIGRGRWLALAEALKRPDGHVRAQQIVAEAAFSTASSDDRFLRLSAALAGDAGRPGRAEAALVAARDGTPLARVARSRTAVQVTLEAGASPAFADFLLERLPELYEAYRNATTA